MDEIREDKNADVIVGGCEIENQTNTSESTTVCSSTAHPVYEHTPSNGNVFNEDQYTFCLFVN